jgi:hypothetical protein
MINFGMGKRNSSELGFLNVGQGPKITTIRKQFVRFDI